MLRALRQRTADRPALAAASRQAWRWRCVRCLHSSSSSSRYRNSRIVIPTLLCCSRRLSSSASPSLQSSASLSSSPPPPPLPSPSPPHLSSSAAFNTAIDGLATRHEWSEVIKVFLSLPSSPSSRSPPLVPSLVSYHLAVQAGMELLDWELVLAVYHRMLPYLPSAQQEADDMRRQQQRQRPGETTTRYRLRQEEEETDWQWMEGRAEAVTDSVLYAAYRLHRHDVVQAVFSPSSAPASSYSTMLLSLTRERRWSEVLQLLQAMSEDVWEDVEMAAVLHAMTAMRKDGERGSAEYTACMHRIAHLMTETGMVSTLPPPFAFSDEARFHRSASDSASSLPFVVCPAEPAPLSSTVYALYNTVHHSEDDNTAACLMLALRLLPALLPSPPLLLPAVAVLPPASSRMRLDVVDVLRRQGVRGQSLMVTEEQLQAVMGQSEQRRRRGEKELEEGRRMFESRAERKRRLADEDLISRGLLHREKLWLLLLRPDSLSRLCTSWQTE